MTASTFRYIHSNISKKLFRCKLRRIGKNFLFLDCRFGNQFERIFARQIIKRSSFKHWAVIEGELTKNEIRFLGELNITRIDLSLEKAMAQLSGVKGLMWRASLLDTQHMAVFPQYSIAHRHRDSAWKYKYQ